MTADRLTIHSCQTDANELEIVKCHGLEPIVNGTMMSAEGLELGDGRSDKEIGLLEELGTQCARALRNLIAVLQKGEAKPPQDPWTSMPNTGKW